MILNILHRGEESQSQRSVSVLLISQGSGSYITESVCIITYLSLGTSLVVQWLRLHAANTGDPGLIPSQGTKSDMLQLRPSANE